MNDPKHWLDSSSGSSELERSVLGAGLHEPPPEGVERALWTQLAATLAALPGPGVASASGTANSGSTAGVGSAFKLSAASFKVFGIGALSGVVMIGGVYAGVVSLRRASSENSRPPIAQTAPRPLAVSSANAQPPDEITKLEDLPIVPGGLASGLTRRGAAAVAESVSDLPALSPSAETNADDRSEPGASPSRSSRLVEEVRLLSDARDRLKRGDLQGASNALETLKTQFPEGALSQEREALMVGYLYRAGQRDEARRRAREFLRHYPASPHAAEIERVAAGL